MTIRTKLQLAVYAPLLMALVTGAALFLSGRATESSKEQANKVESIIRSLNELHSLLAVHLLNHEERSREQFLDEHDVLMRRLSSVRLRDAEQQGLLDAVRDNARVMRDAFLRIVALHERIQSLPEVDALRHNERRLAGQLFVRSRQAEADGLRLRRLVEDDVASSHRAARALILAAILLVSLPLTWMLLRTMRGINSGLATLHRGTELIGAGDLTHRLDPTGEDELARLARAFDRMTASLQGMTVAKSELQREVDEHRRAEEALRESEQRYSAIYEMAPFGIALTRMPDVTLVSVNEEFLRMFGYTREEVIGRSSVDLGIGDPESTAHIAAELRARGSIRDFECARRTESGEERIISLSVDRVVLGGLEHTLTTVQDITDSKRAEAALSAANERLLEADRRKNEFMAVLSHELRNPLAPIKNSLYVLERAAPGSDQARRAQTVIDRQVRQLARLVDDLLDVTRITRGKVELQRQRLELTELVRRTTEDHGTVFEGAEVCVALDLTPEPVFVTADGNRLAQVVGNLLTNAAKFTPRGGRIRVSVVKDRATPSAVIRVEDTGVGMAPELLSRLFEPFMQGDKTLDRSQGGLGLGLALVKGLVELHGGDVTASSDGLGMGAAFVVRLPLEVAGAARAEPESGPRRCASRRVLIIEDNVDAADSLKEALVLSGHEAAVAHNGPEGLAKARELRPEVVFCDIGLPGMDGYEVARAFRADDALKSAFLVALSGYALPEDLRKAADAGFERHLPRPPVIEKLEELLATVPQRATDAETAASSPREATPSSRSTVG